ncbi:MAG: rhomboid family intramembrane serine protease, partial [Gaiellales bacterium]
HSVDDAELSHALADAQRGALIGSEARLPSESEAQQLLQAEIDLGEPQPPLVTIIFLIMMLVVTGWEFLTWGTSPSVAELSKAGGSSVGAFVNGSWWKLLAANLLHANILHVAMNGILIYLMGRWLEHLVGRGIVLATVLWSALLSSVGSVFIDGSAVTIGASGVAFGLVGCAVAADPRARTAAGVIARQLAVINVVATFLIPGLSIGGHLGGLAAGLLVGAVMWRRHGEGSARAFSVGAPRQLVTAIGVAIALPIVMLFAIGPGVFPNDAREFRGTLGATLLERQLSGAKLTDGTKITQASCSPAKQASEFDCAVDGDPAFVRFGADDQWQLRVARAS